MQPIRFYSVQTSSSEKDANPNTLTESEDDKLYKRLDIELRGHDKQVLKSYVKFATATATHLDIPIGRR